MSKFIKLTAVDNNSMLIKKSLIGTCNQNGMTYIYNKKNKHIATVKEKVYEIEMLLNEK